jgi:hypothetical protein
MDGNDYWPTGKDKLLQKRVGEYSKSGVGVDCVDQTFALDASF